MSVIMVIIGIVFGAVIAGWAGHGLFGAVIGGVLVALWGWAQSRINEAEERFRTLERRVEELERTPERTPQPAVVSPPPVEVPEPAPQAEIVVAASPVPAPEPEPPVVVETPAAVPPRISDRILEDAPPATTAQPSLVTEFLRRLAGGNPVVRIGVVVLFFGVAFLFKYAYDRVHIPMELRLIGVALGAIAMLVVGWRFREQRADYGLALQGGGIGLLYLTVFASLKLTAVMPAGLAFALLAAIVAFAAVLAVAQDSLALAMLGVAGGFLAPVLASTGQGNHILLFSYYAVLNAGILAIAWHKAWRALNLLGFVFTFIVGTAWGVMRYDPEHYASAQLFLVLFFLFYVAVALLYARAQAPRLTDYVDGTLVFGVPVVAFGLQAGLVHHIEFATAASAAVAGAFYVGLAAYLLRRAGPALRLLVESFLALGIVFATLAIPLALEARFTATAWALEGAAIVWIGLRQKRVLARAFGYGLQFAAGAGFVFGFEPSSAALALANSTYLGFLFLAVAGVITAFRIHRTDGLNPGERTLGQAFFAWGLAWWFAGGWHEIHHFVDELARHNVLLVFAMASAVALALASRRLAWPLALQSIVVVIPLAALVALAGFFLDLHTLGDFRFIRSPAAIATILILTAIALVIAYRLERTGQGVERLVGRLFFGWGLLWWLAGGAHEVQRFFAPGPLANALLAFVALTAAGLSLGSRRFDWSLAARPVLALAPLATGFAFLVVGTLDHPLQHLGWFAWPLTLAIHLWLLRRHEDGAEQIAPWLHALGVWLLALIGAWELGWQVDQWVADGRVWGRIAWAIVPCALIGLVTASVARLEWPVRAHLRAYMFYGAAPLAVLLVVWSVMVNFGTTGDPRPLPYVPLLNPLDLALAAVVITLIAWLKGLERHGIADWLRDQPYVVWGAVGAIAFLAVNATLLRTLHFWAGVPFDWDAMLHSRLVQAALSILWTSIALAATVSANRFGIRSLWTVGAALLGAVGLKLFFVDFASQDVERIVSFIGVGLIMVAIGYFAPLPPRRG